MSSIVHTLEAKISSRTRRGLVVVTVLMLVTAFAGAYSTQRLFSSEVGVARSTRLHIGLERLLSILRDAETGQRGYIITGREEYLAPYVGASPKSEALFFELAPLVKDDPQQRRRLAALRALAEQKLHELGSVIAVRRTDGFGAAQSLVQTDAGRLLMDSARRTVAEMDGAAEAQLASRRAAARRVRDVSIWVAILSASLTILMSGSFAYWMRRLTRARMEAINQLHDQKELLRVTLASIGEGVATTDAKGRLSSMNIVGSRLTGWEEAVGVGLPIEEVLKTVDDVDNRGKDSTTVRAAIAERCAANLTGETILIARDGTKTHVDCSSAPMRDAFGNRIGSVIVFRNVTIRKQHEQELRDSDRRKGEFLAVMSHELRNPLAAIQGALDLLNRTGGQQEDQTRLCALMARQVRQVVRIIDDLLDVVRVSQGKLELKTGAVDLRAMADIAVETVKPTLDKRLNTLLTEFAPDLPSVQGDAARLSQAVANLLVNASKYSLLGSTITLVVTVEEEQVSISVSDQGIGLCKEDLDRIFEMFAQVGRTDDMSKDGLGVGLSLCRQIIFLHGGQVTAYSAGPGLGSVFTIVLPRREAARLPTAPPPLLTASERPSGARVLVADDNEDAAEALAMLLRLSGYEVSVAHDGEQAAQMAMSQQPDIALLDIGMPKLTGYQVAQHIRSQTWNKRPLLIAITGWGQPEDRRNSAEAGFDKHFTKPVDFETLARAIADATSEKV